MEDLEVVCILQWLILYVNVAGLWCPVIWSEGFVKVVNILTLSKVTNLQNVGEPHAVEGLKNTYVRFLREGGILP